MLDWLRGLPNLMAGFPLVGLALAAVCSGVDNSVPTGDVSVFVDLRLCAGKHAACVIRLFLEWG
jgi:hypothetical protein